MSQENPRITHWYVVHPVGVPVNLNSLAMERLFRWMGLVGPHACQKSMVCHRYENFFREFMHQSAEFVAGISRLRYQVLSEMRVVQDRDERASTFIDCQFLAN
jgi:hypothetical protein